MAVGCRPAGTKLCSIANVLRASTCFRRVAESTEQLSCLPSIFSRQICFVQVRLRHAQRPGHAVAAVEGRAGSVSGEGQQGEDSDALWTEPLQPAIVQEASIEPTEATRGPSNLLGARRPGRITLHFAAALFLTARFLRRAALRSVASLRRYDSPSISTISGWCTSRPTRELHGGGRCSTPTTRWPTSSPRSWRSSPRTATGKGPT